MAQSYIKRILNAQVYDVARETPLDAAPLLSARLGNQAFLKREDLQPVFSFKCRGAYNKMVHLDDAARAGASWRPRQAITHKVSRWRHRSWASRQRSSCLSPHP